MYKNYIVTAKTDRGIKSLKLCTGKDINSISVKKDIEETIKDFYCSNTVEILLIENERYIGVITV